MLLTLIFECFMFVVLKSTFPVFIISLYISFIDGHLFIRNKELGCPYSVYKGTMLIVDQQSLYTTSTV
jgi:hypothetical protein